MGVFDRNNNDKLDPIESGKVLLYVDDYDSIPHDESSGCTCRSLLIFFVALLIVGVIIGIVFS